MINNATGINTLRQSIENNLIPLIKTDYVLLDIPNHKNIGDNLIWEGELCFLKKHIHFKNLYSANVLNIDFNKIPIGKTILFHGGGNWGDLYPVCQQLRLKVVQKYQENRIIVFPQTVYYKNKELLATECAVFNEHPDIYICARDQRSYNMLAQHIAHSKLLLLPDMAFCIDHIVPHEQNLDKILFMQRTDNEVKDNNSLISTLRAVYADALEISDWPTYNNSPLMYSLNMRYVTYKEMLSRFLQKTIFCSLVHPEYGLNCRKNREKYIRIGINFINRYEQIYTTRLHGLILSILLGKKVFIVDNNYGKSEDFYNTWLTNFKGVHLIKSVSEVKNNNE